jgi:hypothetical protein
MQLLVRLDALVAGGALARRRRCSRAATRTVLRHVVLCIVMTAFAVVAGAVGAQAQQPVSQLSQAANASGWTFNIAPYFWAPWINATPNYDLPANLGGRLPTDVSVGPGEYISGLHFAAQGAAEARYDRFSILTDLVYLSTSGGSSHFRELDFFGLPSMPISRSLQTSVSTTLQTVIWTLAGGYTVLQDRWGSLDLLAGFRYAWVGDTTNYSLDLKITGPRGNGATFGGVGSVSGNDGIWNGIAGFRGRILLGDQGLFIPFYFDIGAGGSNLTWQIASGLGYQLRWGAISLTYRYLSFSQSSTSRVENINLGGPMLMANFSF